MAPALGAGAAMWTSHTSLEAPVPTVRALNHIALRARKDVNHDPEQRDKCYEKHPQYCAIHATGLGVTSNPNKQRNLQADDSEENNEEKTAAAAACSAASRRVGLILR
jgi:hypothetical protein